MHQGGEISGKMFHMSRLVALTKAKEMEKQRIKDEREEAYNIGYANGQMDAFTN
jgi:hypothetical protein